MLHHWSRWQGHPDTHRFLTDDQARDWLLRNETDDAEIERVTGEVVESERGPGQPRIGSPIKVTLPDEHIEALDALVASGVASSRSDAIRQAVARGITPAA